MALVNQNLINVAILLRMPEKYSQSNCLLLLLKAAENAFKKNTTFLHLQIIICWKVSCVL